MGSSREWAAKGTAILGFKAVITKSFERIHRSNLIGMGVLPLIFKDKADYDRNKDMRLTTTSQQRRPEEILRRRFEVGETLEGGNESARTCSDCCS